MLFGLRAFNAERMSRGHQGGIVGQFHVTVRGLGLGSSNSKQPRKQQNSMISKFSRLFSSQLFLLIASQDAVDHRPMFIKLPGANPDLLFHDAHSQTKRSGDPTRDLRLGHFQRTTGSMDP